MSNFADRDAFAEGYFTYLAAAPRLPPMPGQRKSTTTRQGNAKKQSRDD